MVINTEAIKQFITASLVPLITGGLVTWLASNEVLSILHLSQESAASIISSVVIFALTAILTQFGIHNVLSGNYTPEAKASRGKAEGSE